MKNKGFIALSLIIIVLAVTLITGSSVALLSIGEVQSSFTLSKSEETLAFVEGCMEDALLRLRSNTLAVGASTITRPEGSCLISASQVGIVWTINATNLTSDYKRTIQVVVTRNPTGLIITSWREI